MAEVTREEFMQFEKRFDAFVRSQSDRARRDDVRFDSLTRKLDQLPWILLGVVANALFTIITQLL